MLSGARSSLRRVAAGAAAVATVLVAASGAPATSTHEAAATGSLQGTVVAALRPSPGAIAIVRAIDVEAGTAVARGRIGTGGAYRLAVPPGIYLVVAEKVSRRAPLVTGFGRLVRVRAGRTSTVRPIARGSATRTTAAVGRAGAPAANGSSTAAAARRPAVAVRHFAGSGPYAYLGKGLAEMVLVDIVGSRCYDVVEWERRGDLLAEIILQQSKWVDPSTRVTPRWIQPTVFVEGSVSTTQSSVSWNIRIREIATGRTIGSDRGTTRSSIFDAETAIAKRLRKQLEQALCGSRYTGRFSGHTREEAGGQTFEYSFSGTVTFVRDDAADSRPGFVAHTIEKIEYTTTATLGGRCSGTATQSVTLGKDDSPFNLLHLATAVAPQKGRRYQINFTVEQPARSTLRATCSGTTVEYPWSAIAQVVTAEEPFYTGAEATRLQGAFTIPATPIRYTWDLRKS